LRPVLPKGHGQYLEKWCFCQSGAWLAVLGVFLDPLFEPLLALLALLACEGSILTPSPCSQGPKWPSARPAQKRVKKGSKHPFLRKGHPGIQGFQMAKRGSGNMPIPASFGSGGQIPPFWAKWPQIGLEKECFRTPFWDLNHPKSGFWPVLGFERGPKGVRKHPFFDPF
jgi:hypothetical protein